MLLIIIIALRDSNVSAQVHVVKIYMHFYLKAVENVARRVSTPTFSIDKIEENLDREIKEEELENEETRGTCKM